MKKILFLLALIFTFGTSVSLAQTDSSSTFDSTFYLVKKTDGGEFYGFILSDDGREILLKTVNIGKIYISKSDIESITVIETEKVNSDGTVKYEDYRATGPFTTRYYFTTNALPIEKGENYAMIHLYGPEVHFAVNDNFSIGVMATWIASPIALAAKYSFDSETDVHYSLGTIVGSSGYLLNAQAFGGLHWATVTKGDREKNISFSAGVAYARMGENFGDTYIGEKYLYRYSYYGSESQYEVPYDAHDELRNAIYGTSYSSSDQYFYKDANKINPSGVIGIAGIAPVGKKASFIFDAMAFIRKAPTVSYTDTTLYNFQYSNYNNTQSFTEDLTIGKGSLETGFKPTIILMPGMRFNNKRNRSFQVALSGVVYVNDQGNVTAFPAPMVSWLRQF
ncbi:MAG: hypothetical protein KJP21_05595 [Bacteroidia bacterium]|nr:hypothetical protein [Bacteroidia bacterium]NNJ55171.1 hypothetical protein [Bacteroidia bacterium]